MMAVILTSSSTCLRESITRPLRKTCSGLRNLPSCHPGFPRHSSLRSRPRSGLWNGTGLGQNDCSRMVPRPSLVYLDHLVKIEREAPMSVMAPEITKVGPEGYEHGWVCVRPPCGHDGPGKVKAADLGVTRNGTVVHRPTGYAVGQVGKRGGKYVASRPGEDKNSNHEKRADAVAAVARRHNKAVKPEETRKPPEKPAEKPAEAAKEAQGTKSPIDDLLAEHAKQVDERIADLQKELKDEQKKDSKIDIGIEIGTIIASIALSFFTGGASLVALAPLLHEHLPEIGKVFAKSAVHIKTHGAPKMVAGVAARARTVLGKIPMSFHRAPVTALGVAKADTSISPGAIAHVAAAVASELVHGGMDPDDANSMALAMASHAALAMKAGKQPWNNDFMAGDENTVSKINNSVVVEKVSFHFNPLESRDDHGTWTHALGRQLSQAVTMEDESNYEHGLLLNSLGRISDKNQDKLLKKKVKIISVPGKSLTREQMNKYGFDYQMTPGEAGYNLNVNALSDHRNKKMLIAAGSDKYAPVHEAMHFLDENGEYSGTPKWRQLSREISKYQGIDEIMYPGSTEPHFRADVVGANTAAREQFAELASQHHENPAGQLALGDLQMLPQLQSQVHAYMSENGLDPWKP